MLPTTYWGNHKQPLKRSPPPISCHMDVDMKTSILSMVQKSGDHQLSLVVYPSIYRVFYIPRWCRISSTTSSNLIRVYPTGIDLSLILCLNTRKLLLAKGLRVGLLHPPKKKDNFPCRNQQGLGFHLMRTDDAAKTILLTETSVWFPWIPNGEIFKDMFLAPDSVHDS